MIVAIAQEKTEPIAIINSFMLRSYSQIEISFGFLETEFELKNAHFFGAHTSACMLLLLL